MPGYIFLLLLIVGAGSPIMLFCFFFLLLRVTKQMSTIDDFWVYRDDEFILNGLRKCTN